ncbi:hypothetical protein GCM10023084_12820 [Streptomyces lacrimifluminis]|uniref:Uncharacterized protein n=1 Tax=Streptomyces lacrimifluminis TaxID=1500077 RepID=A0A917KKX5_9ACTN|nr:hypothetical protein GCM10012282_13890 [Streptomyces lacrimifluminis]
MPVALVRWACGVPPGAVLPRVTGFAVAAAWGVSAVLLGGGEDGARYMAPSRAGIPLTLAAEPCSGSGGPSP